MDGFYYEIVVAPSAQKPLFSDFLNDILPIGYEERDDSFIIRTEENPDTIVWGLEQFAEALSKATGKTVEVESEVTKKQNKDWIRKYQESVEPLEIGRFYIHPSWEEPKADKVNIAIDPALAFGTGHHPTTATCLEAIDRYVEAGDLVCDVGCGSGILAIAAMKLGAVCDACDTDEASILNAQENAKLNGVSYREIWRGSINQRDKRYDVVIANIVADVLMFLANDLKKALKDTDSLLILSGILDKYETKVLQSYEDCNLIERISQGEWVTLVLQKKDAIDG